MTKTKKKKLVSVVNLIVNCKSIKYMILYRIYKYKKSSHNMIRLLEIYIYEKQERHVNGISTI